MARAVSLLGWAFLVGGICLVVIGLAGIAVREGLWAALQMLSPFNIVNFIAVMITLAPGLLLIRWGEHLAKKQDAQATDGTS